MNKDDRQRVYDCIIMSMGPNPDPKIVKAIEKELLQPEKWGKE